VGLLGRGNKTLETFANDSLIRKVGNRVPFLDLYVLIMPFKDYLEFLTCLGIIMRLKSSLPKEISERKRSLIPTAKTITSSR
jgi:hypothetical protein